jgi:single-strand DNA-binding protein
MEPMVMFSVNRVVLVGRLTRDPELRSLASGTSVCSLRIACNSARREADGEYAERPNYFDVSVFGTPAENVSNHMRKGCRVAVDGRLSWREWETANEEKRQAVNIVADLVQFLDRPGEHVGAQEESGAGELVGVGAAEDELSF